MRHDAGRIQARQFLKDRQIMNEILAHHTSQPLERIERDADRNFWMSAEEAKVYGVIDEILLPRERRAKAAT